MPRQRDGAQPGGAVLVTARPVVLWRQPDTLTLWGIPYDMRRDCGQSPGDLWAAQPFPRPGWLGSPGRAAGPREGWRIISAGEAASYGDAVPQAPGEWSRLADFAGLYCPHCDELDGEHGLGCPAAPLAPAGAVLTLDRPDPRS